MVDEILDVVDENDKVIGTESYSKCHDNKILHRGSVVFIFEDDSYNRLLLTRRGKTVKSPLKITVPGGHVGAGHSYLETAEKEKREEVFEGIDFPNGIILKEIFKIKKIHNNCSMFITAYRAVYSGPFSPSKEECEEAFFVDFETLFEKYSDQLSYTGNILLNEYKKRYFRGDE